MDHLDMSLMPPKGLRPSLGLARPEPWALGSEPWALGGLTGAGSGAKISVSCSIGGLSNGLRGFLVTGHSISRSLIVGPQIKGFMATCGHGSRTRRLGCGALGCGTVRPGVRSSGGAAGAAGRGIPLGAEGGTTGGAGMGVVVLLGAELTLFKTSNGRRSGGSRGCEWASKGEAGSRSDGGSPFTDGKWMVGRALLG